MSIDDKRLSKRREGGFTLLEAIVAVGILSTIAVFVFEGKRRDFEHNRAKEVGQLLSMYASATKQWLSDNPITEDTEKKGSLWLKSSECEGNPGPNEKHYLPCHFPEATEAKPISFGQIVLTTNYTVKDEDGTIFVEGITTTSPFSLPHSVDGPQIRADLAGIAAITAASSSSSGLFRSDRETAVITIDMNSSATVGGADWLRVDGSNEMLAPITFDPTALPSEREVRNVSRLVAGVDKLISIGAVGGALSGDIVEVDSNQTLLGTMVVKNVASETGGIILEKGNIVAENGHLIASAFFDSDDNSFFMKPRGDTRLTNIQADGYISSPIFYDLDNAIYRLDPSDLSHINRLRLTGDLDSTASINTTSDISGKNIYADDSVSASIYEDPKNSYHTMDLSGQSRIHSLTLQTGDYLGDATDTTNRLTVIGNARITKKMDVNTLVLGSFVYASEGSSCSTTGTLVRDHSTGDLMYCKRFGTSPGFTYKWVSVTN